MISVTISYKKLWKLIIDRDLTNAFVRKAEGLSPSTFTKLHNNQSVTVEVLARICQVLHCNVGDILDILPASGAEETERGEK